MNTGKVTRRPIFRLPGCAVPYLALGWLVLATGCAPFEYEGPKLARYESASPRTSPKILALGELRFTDPSVTRSNAVRLRAAFAKGLIYGAGDVNFSQFIVAPTNLPPQTSCLVVSGTVEDMKRGGGSAALLLGWNAERWRMHGSFAVRDASGNLLTEIAGRYTVSSGGLTTGLGVSGPDSSDWEYLATNLGNAVGDEIKEWLASQKKATSARKR